jgi:hypothetical protein
MNTLKNKVFNSPSFFNFPLTEVNEKEIQISGLTGSLRSFFISYLNEKK